MRPGVYYTLVVLVSDGGCWRTYLRRDWIASAESADLLGREEVARVLHRTTLQRVVYRVELSEHAPISDSSKAQ